MTKRISHIEDMDNRERIILMTIFLYQRGNPKGVTWGKLWDLDPMQKMMSRQTFSHRLKDLLEKKLVENEILKGKRGNPTLYRLKPKVFAELREFRERFYPGKLDAMIRSFEKDTTSFETEEFVECMIELAFGLLAMLATAIVAYETEGVGWLFYESTYENIEQIIRSILNRASRNNENKAETLAKLFEMLEPFAVRPIGKRFGLDVVYSSKQEIIKAAIERTST